MFQVELNSEINVGRLSPTEWEGTATLKQRNERFAGFIATMGNRLARLAEVTERLRKRNDQCERRLKLSGTS